MLRLGKLTDYALLLMHTLTQSSTKQLATQSSTQSAKQAANQATLHIGMMPSPATQAAVTEPPVHEMWRTEQLTAMTQLPLPTVRKCLKLLVNAGLVDSFRGAQGGYRLNRRADRITLAAVIEAIEGPILLAECHSPDGGHCDLNETCDLKGPLRSVGEIVMGFLNTVTLAELASAQEVRNLLPQTIILRE